MGQINPVCSPRAGKDFTTSRRDWDKHPVFAFIKLTKRYLSARANIDTFSIYI